MVIILSSKVLSPASKELPLKESREKWAYLANKFYNVVTSAEKDDLHRELASYRSLPINPGEDEEVDAWFAKMLTVKTGNTPIFPVLGGFGLSLATMYNSSSGSERDFSKKNLIYADPHRNKTSQLTL